MSETTSTKLPDASNPESRSIRPVIEHALIDYGYKPETARVLIDLLIAEKACE